MHHSDDNYFLLFANCIPVKGVSRSVIYDIQRNNFEFIPNELYTILTKCSKKKIGEIKDLFDRKYDDIINEYFEFLIQNEFVIYVRELHKGFTKFNPVYDVPNAVTNCIIDFDEASNHPLEQIKQQLDELICQALQLRYYNSITLKRLENDLKQFEDCKLRSMEVLVPFCSEFTETALKELNEQFPRLLTLMMYEASSNEQKEVCGLKLYYSTATITSENCCGTIDSMFFRVNIRAFSEAKQFNSCLNKKISIDKRGQIRNCPSMKTSFGHIETGSLSNALRNEEFKTQWGITKDMINVCKVCEFRYMCSDCRAYVEDPDDLYSKPLKCGYDPVTMEWEEWSTHPLKQKALKYYNFLTAVQRV